MRSNKGHDTGLVNAVSIPYLEYFHRLVMVLSRMILVDMRLNRISTKHLRGWLTISQLHHIEVGSCWKSRKNKPIDASIRLHEVLENLDIESFTTLLTSIMIHWNCIASFFTLYACITPVKIYTIQFSCKQSWFTACPSDSTEIKSNSTER